VAPGRTGGLPGPSAGRTPALCASSSGTTRGAGAGGYGPRMTAGATGERFRAATRRLARIPAWGLYAALAPVVALLGLLSMDGSDEWYRDPTAVTAVLTVLGASAVLLAPWRPVMGMVAAYAAQITLFALDFAPNGSIFAVLVLFFACGERSRDTREAVAGLVLGLAGLGALFALENSPVGASDVIGNAASFAIPWGVGLYVRGRRRRTAELEERAERLERERELLALQAVTEERGRIARELHDVVAHAVSVITVQAGAARRVLHADPDAAAEAMGQVEATGRQALAELRRLVGVLRTGGEPGEGLAPQPGLDDLDALVDEARRAGLPVERRVEGAPRPVPAAVGLSAYRIVQEALTNTRKHAGPATAEVVVDYGADDIVIRVTDDGRGAAAHLDATPASGGHGIVGMRERVAVFGGDLRVGPRGTGGWAVEARLPVEGGG
jgi:signal transduction histidine kinase